MLWVDCIVFSRVLLSVLRMIKGLFSPVNSCHNVVKNIAVSVASNRERASASIVDLATLLAILDFQVIGQRFP